MSGHSKWATIKRKKGALDSKRANIFTKLAKNITVAAREGEDQEMNFKLKLAIDKAKSANMPKDNIQRAIDRGAGNTGETQLEEATYECYGPEGVAIIIETITDNTNRTVSDIKALLTKHSGSLGAPGSAAWLFEKKGVLEINLAKNSQISDEIQLIAIEAGALDVEEAGNELWIYTDPKKLNQIANQLKENKITINEQNLNLIAKDEIAITPEAKEKIEKIFEALGESDDVANYYTNAQGE